MTENQPSNTDAILGGQALLSVNAAVLGGALGAKRKLAHELGLSDELTAELSRTHDIFSFETVTVNDRGDIIDRQRKQAFYYTENLGDGIELEMVYIPAGRLSYGYGAEATIDIPSFHIGKYPITQAQYQAIVGKNPAYFKVSKGYPYSNRMPVEQIFWQDTQEFCSLLNTKTGRKYKLPDEFQWEYACRAGTKTTFYFGDVINEYLVNCMTYQFTSARDWKRTTTVGLFPPNNFGLYDLHGNVWEWCEDRQPEKPKSDFGNPRGVVWDLERKNNLIKGGAWNIATPECSAAFRAAATIVEKQTHGLCNCVGFRVICI
ncbi:formylglycine-generating enzyme family protein [Chamaesiphon sp. VAR_48_metabat_403]|uniref:formylglycine-generating enzyme family protein n=1 Tax=Chamaesiphon sp. VAR_48_metabat_403 TaxID=2964700 RepID=UPI00286E0FF9|nr:formylglycine-generating enzyme family protein [Chamaesiphon sp. VAR_48_metabat_403]